MERIHASVLSGAVVGVSSDCKKQSKAKRVITPARKEQNRIAQRLYRQRHKQSKARKEHQSASNKLYAGSKPRPIQPCPTRESLRSEQDIRATTQCLTTSNTTRDPKIRYEYSTSTKDLPEDTVNAIKVSSEFQVVSSSERFIVDDVQPVQADRDLNSSDPTNTLLNICESLDMSLFPDSGYMAASDVTDSLVPPFTISGYMGVDSSQATSSTNGLVSEYGSTFVANDTLNETTTDTLNSLNAPIPSPFASEDQVADGKEATAHPSHLIPLLQAGSAILDDSHNHKNTTYLADPYRNAISFSQVTILSICVQNATCLGMAPEDFISDNCLSLCSPFHRPVSASDDPTALLASVSRPFTPRFLQPTLSQILFPHHPIFDLIPIPAFRERAIMLATTSPALLNPLELKQDILCGGLVCWGTRHGSNHAGKGQPWDLRSWEAAPWFLKKWRLLVGGKDGDLWKQSIWWRNLRGESAAYD